MTVPNKAPTPAVTPIAIGQVPGAKGCYAVMGFGGNGITFSVIAAQMLQRAVLGLPDPDSDLFALA